MNDFADKGDAATRAALAAGREPRLRPAQASRWLRGVARPEAVTLALLALAVLVSARLSPYFADLRFVLESATFYVELAMLALVLTPIIIAGEIDLSPASQMPLELVRVSLPAGAKVSLPAASYAFIKQQIWLIEGRLDFTEGDVEHRLEPGDCLALGAPSDCVFHAPGPDAAEYLVALVRD